MITANVLHKPDRTDRHALILKEAEEQGFEIRWFDAIVEHPPKTGICKAHKQIIRWAKENKLPYVLVLEDDVKFTDKGALKHFLDNMPEEFDIYLGGVCIKTEVPEDRILPRFCCMHCYVVHERFYDTFLGIRENSDIENCLADVKGKYITAYPFIAIQWDTSSDNSHRNFRFEEYLKGKELWKNTQ